VSHHGLMVEAGSALLVIGKTVIVPSDGIGTGLSQLPMRAPKLHQFIAWKVIARELYTLPWFRDY
jgi:hypothetical protein